MLIVSAYLIGRQPDIKSDKDVNYVVLELKKTEMTILDHSIPILHMYR